MPTVVFNPQKEINDLRAEIARLHKRTTELEKRARTAERNLRHMTEAGDELRVNANEGWRQYGETAAEIERLRAENARLREVLAGIMQWNNKLVLALPPEALPALAAARAALAEKGEQ